MQSEKKILDEFLGEIAQAFDKLQVSTKQSRLQELELELAKPDLWDDSANATKISQEASSLHQLIDKWLDLKEATDELVELVELDDQSLVAEISKRRDQLQASYQAMRKDLLFDGQYDNLNAVMKLSAGAGGVDAQDWTEMLERMYGRWAEQSGLTFEVLDRSAGEEAGIKSATYLVSGAFAYGKLRSEHGVHRLVRLSPFNADSLRQTSFALVEVMPELVDDSQVTIADKDLKIDVYRSGGHGGQSVNTTDSAVRITHLPTGIVVAIQNERSQIQNRETALKVLKSRLVKLKDEQQAESIAELRAGESASWGNQIRNYVLHPYKLVKDTRTKYESKDAEAVLDGAIDQFIEAYLSSHNH